MRQYIFVIVMILLTGLCMSHSMAGESWENLPAWPDTKTIDLRHLTNLTKEQAIAQGTADATRDAQRALPNPDGAKPDDSKDDAAKNNKLNGELLFINAVYFNPKGPFKAGFFGGGCDAPKVDRFVEHIRTTKYHLMNGYGKTACPFAEDYEKAYNAQTRAIAIKRFGKDVFDRIEREGKAAYDQYMATQPPPSRIAFIVDSSQVAAPYWEDMVAEVKKSVDNLKPDMQGFTVIYALNGRAKETVAGLSKQATTARKAEAFAAINKYKLKPSGDADMLKAIAKSLEYKPRIIFIVTTDVRGNGEKQPSRKRFMTKLDALLEPMKFRPRIFVLQWMQTDPTGTGQAVADKYGQFKFVGPNDIADRKTKGNTPRD